MIVPFAHAGHWLVQLVYIAPLLLIVAWIVLDKLRSRGESDAETEAAD